MSRAITFLLVAAFLLVSNTSSLAAQGKGHGAATTAAHKPKTTGQPTTARAPKSTTAKGPKTTTTTRGNQATARANQPGRTSSKTTTADVPTTSPNLPRNQRQVDRLRTLLDLPPGTDMSPYAAGFKNQGQFVAAVHVSENLGINFTELKTLMVDQNLSLGQSIQRLKPGVDSNFQADRAIRQSRQQ